MNNRAVTYARVSTDDHAKGGLNIAGQLDLCRAYAEGRGYVIVAEITEDDHGMSGAVLDCPGLNQALEMAAEGKYDVLVVREIDRFARSLAKQLIVEQEFQKLGVRLEYVLENFSNTAEGDFHKNIKAVIAEFERVKINERTRRGRLQKVKSGNVLVHGRPPYGYRVEEQNRKSHLIICEPEARIVRMIFNWYVHGDEDRAPLSSRTIAAQLSERQVPAPGQRTGKNEGRWSYATVQHILKNETYAGTWYYGKRASQNGRRILHPEHKWTPVPCPAIVAVELWKQAQQKHVENSLQSPRKMRHAYLLSHRATCGQCGQAMRRRSSRYQKSCTFSYYYCPKARRHKDRLNPCTNSALFRADHVDSTVWGYIKNFIEDPERLMDGLGVFIEQNQAAMSPVRERMEIVESLLDEETNQLKRISDLYIDGTFSKRRLLQRKKSIEGRISRLTTEYVGLSERFRTWSCFPEQAEMYRKFATEINDRLTEADDCFDHRRKIIEFLDVKVALTCQEDRRFAELFFAFGESALTIPSQQQGKG